MTRSLKRRSAPLPDTILIKGAREHNLDVPHLEIPKHALVVVTGVSGSGKSSLAFDTLYAEGQRRYVESLSAYARQFLGQMEKPKYDHIRGLSPTIAIQQKTASSNPRSTVGTVTEIYDYLRVLYARVGEQRCHQCGGSVSARSAAEIVTELAALPEDSKVTLLAPKAENRKGEFRELFADARKAGFVRVRIDGMIVRLEDVEGLEKKKKHSIELVIDRVVIKAENRSRLTDSVETSLAEGGGKLIAVVEGERSPRAYSRDNACPQCGIGFQDLAPQSFSFNSPLGMCVDCNGLGDRMQVDPELPDSRSQPEPARRRGRGLGRERCQRERLDREHRQCAGTDVPDRPRQALEQADQAPARDLAQRHGRPQGAGHLGRAALIGRLRHALRGLDRPARAALARDRLRARAPALRALLPPDRLRLVRGHPAPARVACGGGGQALDRRAHGHDRGRLGPAHARPGLDRREGHDRGRGAQGDPHPPGLLARRRARLPDARPQRVHAVGRRGPAHPPGLAARLRASPASSTCSTSRRSACTSATTSA